MVIKRNQNLSTKKKITNLFLSLGSLSGVDGNDVVLEAEDEASTFDYRTLCLAQTCFESNPSQTNMHTNVFSPKSSDC